jgi:hypothetical protein
MRLWYDHLLEPNSNSYNVPLTFRISGQVDVEALQRALSELLERHLILRSVYFPLGDKVYQIPLAVAGEKVAPKVLHIQGRYVSPSPPEEVERVLCRPFDLQLEPPCRCVIASYSCGTHLLAFSFHHIVVDGWSLGVLTNELGRLYDDQLSGRSAATPAAPQYHEFSVWQQSVITPDVREAEFAFWIDKLANVSPPTSVLGSAASEVRIPGLASHHKFSIDTVLAERLRAFCAHQRGTLFVGLMAACTP